MTEAKMPMKTFETAVYERFVRKRDMARGRGLELNEFDLSKMQRAAEQEVLHEATEEDRAEWEIMRAFHEELRERVVRIAKERNAQKLEDFQKERARRLKGG